MRYLTEKKGASPLKKRREKGAEGQWVKVVHPVPCLYKVKTAFRHTSG